MHTDLDIDGRRGLTPSSSVLSLAAHRAPRALSLWLLVPLLLATLVFTLGANEQVASAQTANLSIQVVLASNDGSGVDGSLSGISGDLSSRFGQYSRFQRLDSANVSISSGSSRTIGLPNGQSMSISFQGMSGSSYRLSVGLPGGGTTVTAPRGGIFFVAGPSYDGGILIVAIST